ncbi:MAG: hypothetical protein WC360_07165 [Opitutales bacterium]|jgi:antitoxin component of MazEF toxin-antitoxin module
MIKTLRRVGNSHSINFDKALMEQMGVREGSRMQLHMDGRNLVITPVDDRIPDDVFETSLNKGMKEFASAMRNLAK